MQIFIFRDIYQLIPAIYVNRNAWGDFVLNLKNPKGHILTSYIKCSLFLIAICYLSFVQQKTKILIYKMYVLYSK